MRLMVWKSFLWNMGWHGNQKLDEIVWEESFVLWIWLRRVLHVRRIWWCVRLWNLMQTFHWLIALKKVERDAGVSPAALLYAWYMRNIFVQFPCGSSFIGSLRGSWFMESCTVGPRRRESISLSNSSCRSSPSALLRFDLDAILNLARCFITRFSWLFCWLH